MIRKFFVFIALVCIAIPASAANDIQNKESNIRTTGIGVEKIALLSYPEVFCVYLELSEPHAYITFAVQLNGKTQHFRTVTSCQDFDVKKREPIILGEKITLYGEEPQQVIRRENGTLYRVNPSEFNVMYLNPKIRLTGLESPDLDENRHPDLVTAECRHLTDSKERDVCLYWQAGHQRNVAICDEISEWKRDLCKQRLKNIELGKANR
jgi:hypothetical protein